MLENFTPLPTVSAGMPGQIEHTNRLYAAMNAIAEALQGANLVAQVDHGANANYPRPDVRAVWWTGTVEPVNFDADYDIWTGPVGS